MVGQGAEKLSGHRHTDGRCSAVPVRRRADAIALGCDAGRAGDGVRGRWPIVPLAILLRYSFNRFDPRRMMIETFSLDNYVKFFSDPYYTGVLWTTLRVAALCTVVCLVMALPLAYVLARTQWRFKNVLIMLVVLPLFVGNAVRAAGWMVCSAPRVSST